MLVSYTPKEKKYSKTETNFNMRNRGDKNFQENTKDLPMKRGERTITEKSINIFSFREAQGESVRLRQKQQESVPI